MSSEVSDTLTRTSRAFQGRKPTHVEAVDNETEDEVRRREVRGVVVEADEEGDPTGDVREKEELVEGVADVGDARDEEQAAAIKASRLRHATEV